MTLDDQKILGGTVLVTGAGRRIGRALAIDLARHGLSVAIHYHTSKQVAEELVNEITASGGRAAAIRGDLGADADVDTLIDRAIAILGPVTTLVNNASLFENDTVESVTRQSWDAHMAINVWAPLRLTQIFAERLADGANGTVINFLDQRIWNLTPYFTSYTASKSALWTLTQTLAMALAPHVRVNAIGPGPTLPSKRQSNDHFVAQWSGTPLGRPVDVSDICRAVRFILDCPSMTGQMIALDSGQHLGWSPGQSVAEALE